MHCYCVYAKLILESKSFRAAPEGSILLQQYTVAVRSLIQNHRHFTAEARSCPHALPALHGETQLVSTPQHKHNTHDVHISFSTHRYLSAFFDSLFGSLWASLSPLRSAHPRVRFAGRRLTCSTPGETPNKSQRYRSDRLSLRPIKSTLGFEWRGYSPIAAFKRRAGTSSSPNALLTDTLCIQWRSLTPFTGRCRSNRRGERALDTDRAQEDALIPPRWLECHQDDRNEDYCWKYRQSSWKLELIQINYHLFLLQMGLV